MKIAVVGNCQARGIARAVEALAPDAEVKVYSASRIVRDHPQKDPLETWFQEVTEADVAMVVHPLRKGLRVFTEDALTTGCNKLIRIPYVVFTGFQPDCGYIQGKNGSPEGPMGPYHSTIAAVAYRLKLSPCRARSLFNRFVYTRLNFSEKYTGSVESTKQNYQSLGFDLEHLFTDRACNMHTINHPNITVLGEIARQALQLAEVPFDVNQSISVWDELKERAVWPIYPGLFESISGDFEFSHSGKQYGLDEFLELEFEAFATLQGGDLVTSPEIERAIKALEPVMVN